MDHEFVRDIEGRYIARLSMGHEAFGSWLTDELGTDAEKCDELLSVIKHLPSQDEGYELAGNIFRLYLDQDAATVSALELQFETSSEQSQELGLSYYDDELFAACGLDDFEQLLSAWRDFIREQ